MGSSNTNCSYVRLWLILVCLLSIAGCSSLKSSLLTGAATSAVVGVTSVLPGGVLVPTIAAGVTSATASALTAGKSVKGDPISVTADTVVQEAPSNFFDLLGQLVGMGGWLLILIFVAPMVLGWILPGPLERKKTQKNLFL